MKTLLFILSGLLATGCSFLLLLFMLPQEQSSNTNDFMETIEQGVVIIPVPRARQPEIKKELSFTTPQNKSTTNQKALAFQPTFSKQNFLSNNSEIAVPVFNNSQIDNTLTANFENLPFPRELLDKQPQALPRAPLPYPEKALKRKIAGKVTVTYKIEATGELSDIKIIASDPAGYFEQNTIDYLKSWRFSPALYQGEAVTVQGRTTIEYKLP